MLTIQDYFALATLGAVSGLGLGLIWYCFVWAYRKLWQALT